MKITLHRAPYGYTWKHFEITPCDKAGRGSATRRHGWYVKNTATGQLTHEISLQRVRSLLQREPA